MSIPSRVFDVADLDDLSRGADLALFAEAEASGLSLTDLPGNSAKIRLSLDLARQVAASSRTRILDVGAGGRNSPFNLWEPFLPYAGRIDLTGIDVAYLPETAARAAELGFPVELHSGGVESIVDHFGQAAFDAVVCTQVLEQLPRWRDGVARMCEVLKPGGVLYVTCESGDKTLSAATRLKLKGKRSYARLVNKAPRLRKAAGRFLSGEWEQAPALVELRECAESCGVEVETARHYGLRYLKAMQRSLDARASLLPLALEEAVSPGDPGDYLLLYVRALRRC